MEKYDLQTAGGVIQYLLPHAERAVQLKAARSRLCYSEYSAVSLPRRLSAAVSDDSIGCEGQMGGLLLLLC